MKTILLWTLVGLVSTPYILWHYYLSVMAIMTVRAKGKLTKSAYTLGAPILIVGGLVDVFCNLIPLTIIYLEFPRQWLVTQRLKQHLNDDNYRGRFARWLGANLLDPFDPTGKHL